MALIIVNRDGLQFSEWHVGQHAPLENMTMHVDDVGMIQADGDELAYILGRFQGIPRLDKPARVVRWYGDHARFIVGNLV